MTTLRLGMATAALVLGAATMLYANQGHMKAARSLLEQARQELQAATPDKGGHRERAIQQINAAIEQVQRGIDYARE
jgi:hypothetical protein